MIKKWIGARLWELARRAPGTSASFGPVRRLCTDARPCRSAGTLVGYTQIQPPGLAPRPAPATIYPADDWRARRWAVSADITCPPLPQQGSFVVTLHGGRLLGADGAAITGDDALLTEASVDLRSVGGDGTGHAARFRWTQPPIRRYPGRVAALAVLGGHNYFHWMFHLLPRVELLRRTLALDSVDLFATNPIQHPFQEETLATLKVPRDRIIEMGPATHLRADTLLVPSRPSRMSEMPAWVCEFLRQTFLRPDTDRPGGPTRIYVARATSGHRQVRNEPDVRGILHARGFAVVAPETMSVAKQARLFAGADVIVSPHGAGLANMVFCRPGVTLVEIFAPRYINACYWQLAAWVGARYHYVLGVGEEPKDKNITFDQHSDISVDLDDLSEILDLAQV